MGGEAESLDERILAVVRSIPSGKVLTYGAVAVVAGKPGRSRRVGTVLRNQPEGSDVPWHRVVNHRGGISLPEGEDFERQRRLLSKEGIRLRENGTLDLSLHLWWPDEEPPERAPQKKKRKV